MAPHAIAADFVKHYYTTFHVNRAALANIYQEESKFTFEGDEHAGRESIINKLRSLSLVFQHEITKVDCQLSGVGGVLISASGFLWPCRCSALKFNEIFHLMPTAEGGSFHVTNPPGMKPRI